MRVKTTNLMHAPTRLNPKSRQPPPRQSRIEVGSAWPSTTVRFPLKMERTSCPPGGGQTVIGGPLIPSYPMVSVNVELSTTSIRKFNSSPWEEDPNHRPVSLHVQAGHISGAEELVVNGAGWVLALRATRGIESPGDKKSRQRRVHARCRSRCRPRALAPGRESPSRPAWRQGTRRTNKHLFIERPFQAGTDRSSMRGLPLRAPPGQGLLHVLLRHRPRSSGIGCLAMPEITLAPLTDRGRELLDALEAAARGVLPFRTSDDGSALLCRRPRSPQRPSSSRLQPGWREHIARASGRASTRPDRCVAESRTTIRCLRRRRRTARARPEPGPMAVGRAHCGGCLHRA